MKYSRHTHNQVIERKLQQLPSVDADFLWNDMHSILDKEMPQKKERRRFIAWLFTGKSLFLISIVSMITVTGVSLFYLSNKQSAIENNLPQSQKTNPTIQPSMTIISEKENKLFSPTNTDQTKRTNEEETVPSFSSTIDENVIKNTTVSKQTKDNSIYDYIVRNQNNQPIQWQYPDKKIEETAIGIISMSNKSNDQTNFDANAISLTSAQTFLAQMNHTGAAQPRKNIHGHSEKGLYAGIVIGADLSSVHFKSMKTGATKGLLVGYAINEKWSIESGVFWDKKRMFDDGSYFNPPGYTPTSSTRIVAVNGTNRLD